MWGRRSAPGGEDYVVKTFVLVAVWFFLLQAVPKFRVLCLSVQMTRSYALLGAGLPRELLLTAGGLVRQGGSFLEPQGTVLVNKAMPTEGSPSFQTNEQRSFGGRIG